MSNYLNYKFLTVKQLFALLFVVFILLSLFFIPKRSQKTIRLHEDQIELQKITNAIAEFIIVEGFNYKVELVEATVKEARGHLLRGGIDISLEIWRENNLQWLTEATSNNILTDLGEIYSGGRQYWIVSKWYAEEKEIKTVFNMENHWQDFLDPDDPSKGLFFNCIYGWTCRDINRVKLQAYGLDRFYNTVSPVSPRSLKAIYDKAQSRKLPIFGYYWEPNSLMTGQNWHILEEPPYSEEIWKKVVEAASAPNGGKLQQACSFNEGGAHKVANSNLAGKAPGVFQMFQKMKLDIEFFTDTFFNSKKLEKTKFSSRELAQQFLINYPEQWTFWVSIDVQKKIKIALQNKDQNGSTGDKR